MGARGSVRSAARCGFRGRPMSRMGTWFATRAVPLAGGSQMSARGRNAREHERPTLAPRVPRPGREAPRSRRVHVARPERDRRMQRVRRDIRGQGAFGDARFPALLVVARRAVPALPPRGAGRRPGRYFAPPRAFFPRALAGRMRLAPSGSSRAGLNSLLKNKGENK